MHHIIAGGVPNVKYSAFKSPRPVNFLFVKFLFCKYVQGPLSTASQTEHGALATTPDSVVGLAFFFFTYSTWEGRVMFIDDIIIDPAHRGLH